MSADSAADKIDLKNLTGLKQAALVLKCTDAGLSEDEILALLYHDEKLVEALRYFLLHSRLLEESEGKWTVTDRGREWMTRFK